MKIVKNSSLAFLFVFFAYKNIFSTAQIYPIEGDLLNGDDFANFGSSAGTFASNCQSEVISRPPVVIPPAGRHLATLIFFHGMGDEGEGGRTHYEVFSNPF